MIKGAFWKREREENVVLLLYNIQDNFRALEVVKNAIISPQEYPVDIVWYNSLT